ncbi:MAG: hypothetical protein GKR87_04860 [Kiritimatiellae bacterium]|nr:hypothetical protein [Kiritimatiellia bacterium]
MICTTLKEAKAKLNMLVQKAIAGEDVILMRGSNHIAAIIPISDDDLSLNVNLTDRQADRLWQDIKSEKMKGKLMSFDSPSQAVESLLE